MARSMSLGSRTLTALNSTPNDGATDWIAPNSPMPADTAGSPMTATRVTPGGVRLSSSSRFAPIPNSAVVKPVALPPGRARLSTKPAPTGSGVCTNTMATVRLGRLQGPHDGTAGGDDHVRRERDQLRSVFVDVFGIASAPTGVNPHVAAVYPPQLLQALPEGGDAGQRFDIVRSQTREHADAPHALALLRTRRARPRNCLAAEERDELPPPCMSGKEH